MMDDPGKQKSSLFVFFIRFCCFGFVCFFVVVFLFLFCLGFGFCRQSQLIIVISLEGELNKNTDS